MSRRIAIAALMAALALALMSPSSSPQQLPSPRSITLFARYDEAVQAYDGKILSVSPKWGGTKFSNASVANVFTLYPALGSDLEISGVIFFKAWLRADPTAFGKLTFALLEVSPRGEEMEVVRTEQFVALPTKTTDFSSAVAGIKHTFKRGSTIKYLIQFTPRGVEARTYLYWGGEETPTYVALPCIAHVRLSLEALDPQGNRRKLFSVNETGERPSISFKVNVTDPFTVEDIKLVTFSVTDPERGTLVDERRLSAKSLTVYSAVYEANATLPADGSYRITVKVVDSSGNVYPFEETILVAHFYAIRLKILDGNGAPLPNANVSVRAPSFPPKSSSTDQEGRLSLTLPSSSVVGAYDLTVSWMGRPVLIERELALNESGALSFKAQVYSLKVKLLLYGLPLPKAEVSLLQNSTLLKNGTSGMDGSVAFRSLPAGDYALKASFLGQTKLVEISLTESKELAIAIEIPALERAPYFAAIAAAATLTAYAVRRRRKPQPWPFSFIHTLIKGGLPDRATLMILGPPGSGKTVLLESLVDESLRKGKKCVYVINNEFPSKVREDMKSLNFAVEGYEAKGSFAFIDCYSGLAGRPSSEKHAVPSPTDLTELGTEISATLEELGEGTDVYMDSLAPLMALMKPEAIISFIHATGAKVKGA
ncbi:TPA: hypothetical protein EYP26_05725, partial [Candidatus Bathyarchaeota archaeon]|nr:hypothetical protein [Candidatus Bathyarchaeota archaeon]